MLKKLKLFIIISITVLINACANIGVTQMHQVSSKPINCELDIYSSKNEIQHKFKTICLIDSRTGTTAFHSKTAAAAVNQAKPYACKCGADAILIEMLDTEGVTMTTWGKGKAVLKGIKYIN